MCGGMSYKYIEGRKEITPKAEAGADRPKM